MVKFKFNQITMGAKCCTPTTRDGEQSLEKNLQDNIAPLAGASLYSQAEKLEENQKPPESNNPDIKSVSLMLPMTKKCKLLKKRRLPEIEKLKLDFLDKERPIFGPYSYTRENTTYKGNYFNGKRQGFGYETNDDGDYYIGQFREDRKHG